MARAHVSEEEALALAATLLLRGAAGRVRRPRAPAPRRFEGATPEIAARLGGYFRASRRRVVAAVGRAAPGPGTLLRLDAAAIDSQAAAVLRDHLARSLRSTAAAALREGFSVAQRWMAERGLRKAATPAIYGTSLDQANERAMAWADQHAARLVTNINQTTRTMVREGVTAAVEAGASAKDLAKVLEESIGFSDYRSLMIARTELVFANSYGNVEGYRANGVTSKEWMVSQDEVCEACEAIDGEVIPIDDDFTLHLGKKLVAVPCPPGHPNCRCDILPVTPLDAELAAAAERRLKPRSRPTPKKPAPPPPPVLPTPAPPQPPPPPLEPIEEVHERMKRYARETWGAECHNPFPVRLDRFINGGLGHRTWTGLIELSPYTSSGLREAFRLRAAGEPLTADAALAMKVLFHEEIHGLGPRRAIEPDPAIPAQINARLLGVGWRSSPELADVAYYQTPIGRVLEEGLTETLALQDWRAAAEGLGFKTTPGVGPQPGGFGARGETYMNEREVVGELIRLGAGEAGEREMLLRLHTKVAPIRRAAALAEAIVGNLARSVSDPALRKAMVDAAEALIQQRFGFAAEGGRPDIAPSYFRDSFLRITRSRTLADVAEARAALRLI